MASTRKLELIIEIAVRQQKAISKLIDELNELSEAGKKASNFKGNQKDLDALLIKFRSLENQIGEVAEAGKSASQEISKGGKISSQAVTALATSYIALSGAIQSTFTLAQVLYSKTIGLSEELNQQLLKNAANIAATSRVEIGGNLIEGVEAVKALQPELRAALQELEVRTEKIAGVTDQQVRTAFDAVIGKVGLLNGQSERFNNSIESSTELAAKLTAALSANNLSDTTQIYQEIGDLITGDITADSALARALAIDRNTILQWQQQGLLVDNLIERLGGFEDAANLASNSISNVTSNFISLTERISRNATADLLDPIAQGLVEIFNFVSENEDTIVAEIKVLVDALSGIATEIGMILSPLSELGDDGEQILTLLLDGFQGIERILQIVGPLLQATIANAVDQVEKLVEAFQQVNTAFNTVFGGLRNVNEALEAYGRANEVAAAGSKNLVDSIEDAGSKSEATQKLLKEQAEAQIAANNSQIDALRELAPVTEQQRQEVKEQISALQGWNDKLDESVESLTNVGTAVNILSRELPNTADTFEEVSDRALNALQKLEDGSDGTLEKVGQNLKQLQDGINQLFNAGEISREDAVAQLERAIEAPGLELQQKLALADQVRKINKTTTDERIALIGVELKEVQAGLSESERATAENVQKVSALRQQELQARIDQVAEAIRQEEELISQGAGSDRTLTQLKNQQRTLGAELKDLAVSQEKDLQDARIREIDRAQLDIQELTLQGRRSINQEEQALLQERARNAKLTEGQISARLAQLRAAASQEQLESEIRLQEQRAQIFEEGSRKRREAELRLSELRLSLSEATAAREAADRQAAVAVIDTQIQQEQQLQQRQQQRLQLRQQAEDRILASLNTQRELFESQLNLISERNRLAQSLAGAQTEDAERALQIQQELANNENLTKQQRKQLEQQLQNLGFRRNTSEKKIAEEILQRKKEEIQLRAQDLEAQQAAERAQLQFQNQLRTLEAQRETRREQARVRELEFQQKLLQLEAQKAEASGDARAAQIAQEGVANAGQAIQEQQQAVAAARAAEQATSQINQDATQALAARQARESFQFARSVAQESQQLANELGQVNEKVGKRAQKFANQQDDIADAAAADAAQTLTSLQQLRTNSAIEELATAQQKATTELAALDTMNQQLAVATALADEAERRLAAVNALQDAVGEAAVTPIPSLDTGGPLQPNRTTLIHAGELLIPGAPSRSAAVNAIATGQPIQAVRSDGFYKGPGGYVLNRQDVSSLMSTPSSISSTGTPAGNGISINGGTQVELSPGELVRQTELLNALVSMQQSEASASAYERRLRRHKRA